MKAVILAGGKGTRLGKLTLNMPKALVKIGGKPILEHQLALLRENGVKEVWMLLGYLGEEIKKFLLKGKWGVQIRYCEEKIPLGTAGALGQLEKEIKEDFLVLSGDVVVNFDIARFEAWHKKKRGMASLMVHPNDHPFDSDLVEADEQGKVLSLLKRPHREGVIFHNRSIASVYIFSPRIFKYIPKNKKTDIEKDVLPQLLRSKEEVYAYNTPEYIKDMGTPERLAQARKDWRSGKVKKLSLRGERRAVFFDRDGVMNEEVDQLSKIEDFKLYDFTSKAIRKVNKTDYLAIIISNQPMIAKGFMTEKDLDQIHKKLETELGRDGAKIDAIYYCPHHPESGFRGERTELKIKCTCRKPNIGLFLRAEKDFHVNLKASYMIGDQTSDILAGQKAGLKTILAKTGYAGKDGKYSVKPDFITDNLFDAIKKVAV